MKTRLSLMTLVVILLAACTAQARTSTPPYLHIGADPMGSYTLKAGEFWDTTPTDLWVTTRGGSGKWYSGILPEGMVVAAREIGRRDYSGYYVSVREAVAIRVCGNITKPAKYEKSIAKPAPPPKPEVRYIPGPIQTQTVYVQGPERIVVRKTYPRLPRYRVPDVQAQTYMVSHQGLGQTLVGGAFRIGAMAARKPDRVMMVQQQSTGVALDVDNTVIGINDNDNTNNNALGVEQLVVTPPAN